MQQLPPHTLMQRAGEAIARLALAIAPHAGTIWIACGPGNNGGDGMQAAAWLQRQGKRVLVTLLQQPEALPQDARAAHAAACAAGVGFVDQAPPLQANDLCIDALLGIGASRAPSTAMLGCIAAMQAAACQTLAVDLPTGLDADTGHWLAGGNAGQCAHADHTLTLLTLKPGLFTAHGRDAAGTTWWGGLDTSPQPTAEHASAWLHDAHLGPDYAPPVTTLPQHASHKGSFGDVCIVGGAPGMAGAAWLAGSAALHAGAGRVYAGLLDLAAIGLPLQPELMPRPLACAADLQCLPIGTATTACGCGGGTAVAEFLPDLLQQSPRLVIDADGLNAIAGSPALQESLCQRTARGLHTILTPHPLEAARLLGTDAATVQHDRLHAACALAEQSQAVVVLKGSGTVVAAPAGLQQLPSIHFSGNARLATAGTGDVLAGCMAACWAQLAPSGASAWRAATLAVQAHGLLATRWPASAAQLTAGALAQALTRPQI